MEMMDRNQRPAPRSVAAYRIRLAALCLAVAGILFMFYPALRPFSDEVSMQGAAAFASPRWVVAHVLAILSFILIVLGLWGWRLALAEAPVERLAFRSLVVNWLGIGLLLPYYGLEAFSVHAVGQAAVSQNDPGLMALANAIRTGPGLIMFVAGLLLLAAGGILVGVTIWRSQVLPRWSGVPFALALVLYIPQFFGTQPLRVAHGLLLAAGCLWIAAVMWRQSGQPVARDVSVQAAGQANRRERAADPLKQTREASAKVKEGET